MAKASLVTLQTEGRKGSLAFGSGESDFVAVSGSAALSGSATSGFLTPLVASSLLTGKSGSYHISRKSMYWSPSIYPGSSVCKVPLTRIRASSKMRRGKLAGLHRGGKRRLLPAKLKESTSASNWRSSSVKRYIFRKIRLVACVANVRRCCG